MEDNVMHISPENIEVVDASEYCEDLTEYFGDMPEVARPLIKGTKEAFSKIENMLYSAPAFINLVKASVPEQAFQAILTNDQKAKLASGALKLMTKKDGSLMANLVNPETKCQRLFSTHTFHCMKKATVDFSTMAIKSFLFTFDFRQPHAQTGIGLTL